MSENRGNGVAKRTFRGVLDPVDRSSEVLFGLIMVMTFTNSLSVAEAGRADVRSMLIGALGCNLAWGIIDAVMFFMSSMAERKLAERTVQKALTAPDEETARDIVAEALPPIIRPALSSSDLDRIRSYLARLPANEVRARPDAPDVLGALGVFLLVFLCTFPVVAPFTIMADATLALRVSNTIASGLLFLTGYSLGLHSGSPFRLGLRMVAIGLLLVAIASALGG
ncbi:VIT1/CCC1 transporter family protein [Bradyrhizobium sp. BRP14]|nr:VIT1/CCC1 transporter family protein [Bradyrhizobium sp. BRP14]